MLGLVAGCQAAKDSYKSDEGRSRGHWATADDGYVDALRRDSDCPCARGWFPEA